MTLPDGSVVRLNSVSRLSYKPLGWYFSRSAELSGEAFFEVEKGSKFTIYSMLGSTSVLGTSFNNVTARDFSKRGKQDIIVDREPYWRTDFAFEYSKPSTGTDWAFGVSLINIFN